MTNLTLFNKFYCFVLCSLSCFLVFNTCAQPINDSWSAASEISIDDAGYKRGTFQSDTVDVSSATNEFGEYLDNPSYPKTVWYKFSIPTKRVVSVKVLQPTEILQSTDAGFVVYKQTTAVPGAEDLAVFTPFYSLASYSENVCLESGVYYIQAVAKNSANSDIYVELVIAHTYTISHSEAKDQIESKYDFGVVGNSEYASFNWSCTSMDSELERAHITGPDSLEYNKSLWVKFTTDHHIDLLHYNATNMTNGLLHVQLWEGDIDSADVGNIAPIYQAALDNPQYYHYLPCLLDSNTTYTIQLVVKESNANTTNFWIGHLGEGQVTGAYPQEIGFHPNNQFGSITPLPDPGVELTSHDYFSCLANLENDSIVCGTANTSDTAFVGTDHFELTTWFTFGTDAESNIVFTGSLIRDGSNIYEDHYMGYRVFNQNIDNDCVNYNYPGDIYFEGIFPANGVMQITCLPPGDYALQLLGRTAPINQGINSNFQDTHLGSRINLTINCSSVPLLEYGLDAAGEVDWINGGSPLLEGVTYYADSAYFSCTKTVIPDTSVCDPLIDRAIYRELIIGDADGDAVADSGMLIISGLAAYNVSLNQASNSPFYKGDANALATAQSAFSWPNTIDGLEPYDGCNMYDANFAYSFSPYFYADYDNKKYCVTPGTYTLTSVGDSIENGLQILPAFRFEKTISQFSDPTSPENIGDIIGLGLNVTSQDDYFSCLDNPDTIAGHAPCGEFTKQLYREFYLSQPCNLSVNSYSSASPYSQMRLFSGRVSDVGIEGLTLAPFHSNNCYNGNYYGDFSTPACSSVPAGWYTAVSYGYGPNYDNNFEFHEEELYGGYSGSIDLNFYSINEYDRVTILVDTAITPGPFYNRPHKACAHPDTIKYVNTGTIDIPSTGSTYTFCQEYFSAQTDTPFVDIPINACPDAVRLAYYVFTIDDEYYTVIDGINSFYSELYELDAREDSLLFPTTDPLMSCDIYPYKMEACRLQPGTYTLVVYGNDTQQCTYIQPNIYVAPVGVSRFDFANHAYDYGLVPPDNTAYGGAVGDVHPTNTNWLPSNDFIYCTTGAFDTDPSISCSFNGYSEVYPDTINSIYYDDPAVAATSPRRNLWYTFVLQGTGNATVQVRNLTSSWTPAFSIYESDVDGLLPFTALVGTSELDSTIAQGLTFIKSNSTNYYCWQNRPETIGFQYFNDPCIIDSTYRRYYVLIDTKNGVSIQSQVDVQVTWNPIEAYPQDPVYDFFYEANVLGAGEIAPPYSNTPLETETLYFGGWGNLSCATSDTTDNLLNGCADLKTLWYKVNLNQRGFLYLGTETDSFYPSIRLLKQVNAPDSIVSPNGDDGLLEYGAGSYTNLSAIYSNAQWRYHCLDSGTYYINFHTCSAIDTSEVRLLAYFEEISGNNCENAPFVEAPTLGVYTLSDPLGCHTMGDDFGEDGSDMGCLLGPQGYASSWFKFSYTGTDLVDILFQLNLGSLSNYGGPEQVRYRLFYGDDCATMIEGAECSVNAYINNSVACISNAEGDFYVQVVYPISASGTLGFTFTVSENTNPDCNPFTPSLLTSDFVHQMNCDGDALLFTNYSTSGSNLSYFWDFGDGDTSTDVNPTHAYSPEGTYTVTLGVVNPATQDTVVSTQDVDFQIGSSPLELGADQVICLGASTILGGFISQATYDWSTNEVSPEITVQNAGDYYLDLTVNGCLYSDTVHVDIIDLSLDLGADVEMCLGDTLVLTYEGSANPDYNWSTGATDSSIVITISGNYWLELSQGACLRADTLEVVVYDLTFALGNDTTICEGTSYYLNPDVPDGVSFDWNTSSNIDSILISAADTYTLEIELAGCTYSSELEVTVLDLTVELGTDTTICVGETLTLSSTTNTAVNYTWNDNSTNPTLDVNTPGWYVVDVEALSCLASDSLLVSVLDLSFELPADTTICLGANLLINPQLGSGLNYDWNTGELSSTITVDTAGVYELIVDSIGCFAQSDIAVNILDLSFSLGPDSVICDGQSIVLSPDISIGTDFLWSDNSTNPNLSVNSTGTYSLDISMDGCTVTDDVQVTVFYVDAVLEESLSACLHDTTLFSVSGADSLSWNSGIDDITEIDELNFWFHPAIDGTFQWTAYENGCAQLGSIDFEVVQPYIPNPVFDDIYCLNEIEIVLPVIDYTVGDYTLEGLPISNIDIGNQGAGDFEILYSYTDTNSCAYQITLDYTIVDTTTISINPIGAICADAEALDLSSYLSDGMGETSMQYNMIDWTIEPAFHTDSIQQDIISPLAIPIRYTYINGQNCQSIIQGEVVVHPLPVPEYSVSPICAGELAVFSNNSTVNGSSIDSEEWTFQNNGTYSGNIPSTLTYVSAGLYEITLEVISEIGCSAIYIDSLEVMALPILTLDEYGPFCINDGDIGLPIHTPIDGIFTYEGNVESNFDTEDLGSGIHAYTFSYTNSDGCYHELISEFVVNDSTTIAIALIDPICIDAESLDLLPYLSDGLGDVSIQYDLLYWTNQSLFYADSVQQDIINPISIPIVYEYVNANNCTSVVESSLTVHPMPIADFEINPTCVGEEVVFVNNSSVNGSGIANEAWIFENNGTFSGNIPTGIIYDEAGFYDLSLEVTSDIGCVSASMETLEIMPLPILSVDAFGPFCHNDGNVGLPVAFPAGGDFIWAGNVIPSFNTYDLEFGTHDYVYSYTDMNGCFNDISGEILVNDTTTIFYTAPFDPVCIDGDSFDLEVFKSHPDGETFVQYNLVDWTADDVFQVSNVSQNIVNPLAVPVLFSYTNTDNCTSNLTNAVVVHPLPVINISVPDICANEALEITNNSFVNGSGIASVNWDIEEQGVFDTYDLAPMYFDEPDTLNYSIDITSDIGCYRFESSTFMIFTVPETSFNWTGACDNVPVIFESTSTIDSGTLTAYTWIIDGSPNPGVSTNFEHLFTTYGAHESGLIAVSDLGCTDTLYQNLYINPSPTGGMLIEDHCLDNLTLIQPNPLIPEGDIVQIDWLANGEFGLSSTESFEHVFQTHGIHTIHQIITSEMGCQAMYSEELRVYPLPEMAFETLEDEVCSGDMSTLYDASIIAPPSEISTTNWAIDHFAFLEGDSASWISTNPGYVIVELTGVSDFGCIGTITDSMGVNVLPKPEGYFVFNENPLNISEPIVQITDLSSQDVIEWNYDMGDGYEYATPHPKHIYEEAGNYRVVQYIINEYGCRDTTSRMLRIEGFIVYVPNAFTPNSDGINDIFKPSIFGEDVARYTFQIWNRHGEMIFDTSEVSEGWNGNSADGEYYTENTIYTYYVLVQGEIGKTYESRGSVMLIR